MDTTQAPIAFSINFDYRCPFARNANEHVLAALDNGAPWDVAFLGFSLHEAHVAEGEPSLWDQPERRADLMAGAVGIAVRDAFPEHFRKVHAELFRARHDEGGDLRDDDVIRAALTRGGADPDAVYAELERGWPFDALRKEHESLVADRGAFGVPTFVRGDQAAFVRIMTRPGGDAELATRTVTRVLDLLSDAPELNEFKHTTIER